MMRVFIEAISGPGQGNRIPVGQNQVLTIGRTEWSDICIANDPQISGKHFQIENTGSEVRVADLNSTNGTMVNGQFIKQAVLSAGDQLVAGSTTFVVHIELPGAGGQDAPAPSPYQSLQAPAPLNPYPAPPPHPTPPLVTPPVTSPIASPVGATPISAPNASPIAGAPAGFQSPIFVPPSEPAPTSTPPPASIHPTPPPAPPSNTPFVSPIQLEPTSTPLRQPAPTSPVEPPRDHGTSAGSSSASASSVPAAAAAAAPPPPPPAKPQVVLDERRQFVGGDSHNAKLFQKSTLDNGLVLLEGFPPADPEQAGAARIAVALSQIGPISLIAHFSKASLPLPLDVTGKPLFHWLPEESAREFGPLIISPKAENAHLPIVDDLWGQDAVLAIGGHDTAKLEEHLIDLIHYNPIGFRRSNTLFGYCWPINLVQLCKSVQPGVAADILGDSVLFFFCESSQVPGAWCLIGKPGLESTLQQIGFQEVQPAAEGKPTR